MLEVTLQGKTFFLLTLTEKAEEMGISVRHASRLKQLGYLDRFMQHLPGMKRTYYSINKNYERYKNL